MPVVRCTKLRCRHEFEVLPDRLGKNLPCPACGVIISAVAVVVEDVRADATRVTRRIVRYPLEALLDNVRSLWNVGSMFRSADAAGIRHLHLTGITGYPPRKEIEKTALGATSAVAWSYHVEAASRVASLRAAGAFVVALEAVPHAVAPTDVRLPDLRHSGHHSVLLVVGNEVAGVAEAILSQADLCLALPMRGVKSSVNAAVAFGVAAYLLAERLDAAGHGLEVAAPAPESVA